MPRSRRRERHRRTPDEAAPAPAEAPRADAPSPPARRDRDGDREDLVPRPSKMRYVALFLAGIFIGRVASENFAAGPLDALDLFMYAGLAISIAWAWRSWARRAMIQRHLARQRRERAARRNE